VEAGGLESQAGAATVRQAYRIVGRESTLVRCKRARIVPCPRNSAPTEEFFRARRVGRAYALPVWKIDVEKRHPMLIARVLAATAAILASLGSILAGQIPSNSRYVVLDGGTGNRLIALDAVGAVTTTRNLPGAFATRIEEAPGRRLVVWDSRGVHTYDTASGTTTSTSLTNAPSWGFVDEDGGMVWGTSLGAVLRSDDLAGTNTRQIRGNNRLVGASGAWNGTTGGYVVSDAGITPFLNTTYFLDRSGGVVLSITGTHGPGDWSPWTGDFIFGQSPSTLVRLSGTGMLTTITFTGPIPGGLVAVEVLEQTGERVLALSGLQGDAALSVVTPGGGVTSIGPPVASPFARDVVRLGDRSLWSAGKWRVGSPAMLDLDFGPAHAGAFYQVALSLGHRPGIPVGPAGVAHLAPDALFALSVAGVPGLFVNFGGTLDAQGRAPSRPTVNLPPVPGLRGVRVFGAAVAYTLQGARTVSNAWGIVLE